MDRRAGGARPELELTGLDLRDVEEVPDHAIEVADLAIDERERARLRARSIGFVFQAFHLLPDRSVLENTMMSMLYSGVPRD